MKQAMLLLIAMSAALCSLAQNVGIGTTDPKEKLDVNGNTNINGNIKINGTTGQPGQVLMTNSAGTTQWGSFQSPASDQYKNFVCFANGSGSWNVPDGVTQLLIEVWGGGGGGSAYGGGGGGGYARSQFSVTAGTSITYTVGLGGSRGSGTNNGQSGGTSTVNVSGVQSSAYGGDGAITDATFHILFQTPDGGSYNGGQNTIGANGEAGYQNNISYVQKSTGVFLQTLRGGKGGDGANTVNTGGHGGFANINSQGNYEGLQSDPSAGRAPGGGGGGGGTSSVGANGGSGRIIIWY